MMAMALEAAGCPIGETRQLGGDSLPTPPPLRPQALPPVACMATTATPFTSAAARGPRTLPALVVAVHLGRTAVRRWRQQHRQRRFPCGHGCANARHSGAAMAAVVNTAAPVEVKDLLKVAPWLVPALCGDDEQVMPVTKLTTLIVEAKEGPGPIQGVFVREQLLPLPPDPPVPLRTLSPDSVDLIVETAGAEMALLGGIDAWHCRFYPLGGHHFSLAQSFIVNLASVAKVLRPGGRFVFRTLAELGSGAVVPFAFLRLQHLPWDVRVIPAQPHGQGAIVVCTIPADAAATKATALTKTPSVVAEECLSEESRQRYCEIIRPLIRERGKPRPIKVLDVGGGNGSLAAWLLHPDVVAADGPCQVTLMEENPELAQQARGRLDEAVEVLAATSSGTSCTAEVFAHGGGAPWPFEDGSFDVVVLAFVLHHVPLGDGHREALLREARRMVQGGGHIVVLEDQPDGAVCEAAKSLAWLVTEEHFRPFGQKPEEFLSGVLPDEGWRDLFRDCGLAPVLVSPIPGSLRHPVPHVSYILEPIE